MALGALFAVIWRGWTRVLGLVPVALSLVLWVQTMRPDALISDDGGLVGVMTEAGRALNKSSGGRFVSGIWLENDGDGADQAEAAARWHDGGPREIALRQLGGKRAAAALTDCAPRDWVVLNAAPPGGRVESLPCTVLTPARLRRTGAVALYKTEGGVRMVTVRDVSGTRLWSPQ